MNFDEIIKQASEAADQAPPITPLQRAPYEYLREEFRAAFREARGEAAAEGEVFEVPEWRGRPIQFVLRLASRALELLDDSLSFSGLDFAAVGTRSASAEVSRRDVHAVADIAGGFEVRLIFSGEGALQVDMFRGGAPYRPFTLGISTHDGLAIAEEVECSLSVASVSLPVQAPGYYVLHLKYGGLSHRMTYEVKAD